MNREVATLQARCVDLEATNQVLHDRIRDLEQAMLATKQYLSIFRLLFAQSSEPMFVLEAGRFTECNQATLDLFGGTQKTDIVGLSPIELSPERQPDGRCSTEKAQEMIATAFARGSFRFEWVHCFLNGTTFPAEIFLNVIPLSHQQIIYGSWRDISDRKRQEAERVALQQQIIEAQHTTLRELSTPLIPITNDVVIMPLVGTIDSQRAQMVLEALLDGVARHQASLVILDITGVAVVDTQVAQAFIQAAQAVKLLGAQVMLTGIQPPIAQTLVTLGVDLSGVMTRGSLQAGIAAVLAQP